MVHASKIRMYDITSPGSPQKLADIHFPEVDQGADIYSVNFGVGNIAAISLSSAGVSWYDFTNAAAPTPVAHLDLSEVENTYTLGVRGTRQSPSDPSVWIIADETEFWNNFHAVRLVTPDVCTEAVASCENEKSVLQTAKTSCETTQAITEEARSRCETAKVDLESEKVALQTAKGISDAAKATCETEKAVAAASATNECDDSSRDTWQALAIIFLVLTIVACCGAVFFFLKWNMEVAFKFQQMGEYVEQAGTHGGSKFDDP